ncbi:hypothetical protein PIB30_097845 [Stylosanthes scabra]|uniref:Uncharacterized protein n=1 Tax=Stylosanthes scabra TaxID=79078 RepID=A0ABU6TXY0_9FABA|nr:hypothetical protein [Stylosanthes scabra]
MSDSLPLVYTTTKKKKKKKSATLISLLLPHAPSFPSLSPPHTTQLHNHYHLPSESPSHHCNRTSLPSFTFVHQTTTTQSHRTHLRSTTTELHTIPAVHHHRGTATTFGHHHHQKPPRNLHHPSSTQPSHRPRLCDLLTTIATIAASLSVEHQSLVHHRTSGVLFLKFPNCSFFQRQRGSCAAIRTSSAQNHFDSVSLGELSVSLSTLSSTPPPIPIITGGILLSSIAGFFSFRMVRKGKALVKATTSVPTGSTTGNPGSPLNDTYFDTVCQNNAGKLVGRGIVCELH